MGDGIGLVGVGPVVDAYAAGGLAREGDLGGIPAEEGDVVSHPLDGGPLVAEAEVLRLVRGAGEAEDVEAVVYCYDDDIICLGEVHAFVERSVGVADGESSAVEEDEDGFLFLLGLGGGRGPDVQRQAVLALGGLGCRGKVVDDSLSLGSELWVVDWFGCCQGAVIAERCGGVRGFRDEPPWWRKPQVANRGLCVWNT